MYSMAAIFDIWAKVSKPVGAEIILQFYGMEKKTFCDDHGIKVNKPEKAVKWN